MMRKGSSAEIKNIGDERTAGTQLDQREIELTGQSFAGVGVALQGFVAVHAQALVGAVRVDASLTTRKGGGALVNIHASLPIILQVEPRPAFTLVAQEDLIRTQRDNEHQSSLFTMLHCDHAVKAGLFKIYIF